MSITDLAILRWELGEQGQDTRREQHLPLRDGTKEKQT
jgi:hypothetical protein